MESEQITVMITGVVLLYFDVKKKNSVHWLHRKEQKYDQATEEITSSCTRVGRNQQYCVAEKLQPDQREMSAQRYPWNKISAGSRNIYDLICLMWNMSNYFITHTKIHTKYLFNMGLRTVELLIFAFSWWSDHIP